MCARLWACMGRAAPLHHPARTPPSSPHGSMLKGKLIHLPQHDGHRTSRLRARRLAPRHTYMRSGAHGHVHAHTHAHTCGCAHTHRQHAHTPAGSAPTEEAVVLAGAADAAVGQDLQVEAGAAVQLPSPQDALQVRQVRRCCRRRRSAAAGRPLRRGPAVSKQRRALPGGRQQEMGAHRLPQAVQAAQESPHLGQRSHGGAGRAG